MNKKIIILVFFLIGLNFSSNSTETVFILYKVNNEVVSNIDIENEAKYLTALNNQLKKLDKAKVLEIAKDSLIKEKVKKNELLKYYILDQKNPFLNELIKNFYLKIGLKNEDEFNEYLKSYGLNVNDVKKKIEIESTWNELIYRKYESLLKIDKEKIKNEVKTKKLINKKSFLLSEIVFEKSKDKNILELIQKSIKKVGFDNTANIYSISDTSKFGGKIGWVDEQNLNKKILKIISSLDVGSYTVPIKMGNSFLIILVNDKKEEAVAIDEDIRIEEIIRYETDRQLSQFSKVYYNKVKINTKISEL